MEPNFGFPSQVEKIFWDGQDVDGRIFFLVRERDVKVGVVAFRLREKILVVDVGGLSPGVEQHPGSRIELELEWPEDLTGR